MRRLWNVLKEEARLAYTDRRFWYGITLGLGFALVALGKFVR